MGHLPRRSTLADQARWRYPQCPGRSFRRAGAGSSLEAVARAPSPPARADPLPKQVDGGQTFCPAFLPGMPDPQPPGGAVAGPDAPPRGSPARRPELTAGLRRCPHRPQHLWSSSGRDGAARRQGGEGAQGPAISGPLQQRDLVNTSRRSRGRGDPCGDPSAPFFVPRSARSGSERGPSPAA